jgi:hypothetical protein
MGTRQRFWVTAVGMLICLFIWAGLVLAGPFFVPSLPAYAGIVLLLAAAPVVFLPYRTAAVVMGIVTIGVGGWSYIAGAREDYCWRYADRLPDKSVMYATMSARERAFMGQSATGISGWLRGHLSCDRSVTWSDVVKGHATPSAMLQ